MNDHGYSPDVELDENGRLVATRDFGKGETIKVPLHLISTMRAREDLMMLVHGPHKRPK